MPGPSLSEGGMGLHGDEEHVALSYIILPVGMAQGAVLYFDGTSWSYLGAGTSGYYLKTNGPGADPSWATVTSGDSFPANPEQGNVIYFDGAAWQNLHHGANGNVLKSQGHGANPIWGSVSGTVPNGSARGDIMWWNGSSWVLLAAGNDMDTLHIFIDENGKNVMWIADSYIVNQGTEIGDVMYYNGGSWPVIHHGTAGQFLKTNGHGAAPSWADIPNQFPSSPEQGDIIYWNGSNWVDLSHGTAGQLLTTQGHGANPSWTSVSGTVTNGTEQGDVLYWNGSAWTLLAHGTNGQAFVTKGHGANPVWQTLSGTVPSGSEQGDILYWNGSSWVDLSHGTAGQVLQTGGHGANPSWQTPSAGGSTFTVYEASSWAAYENAADARGTRFTGNINGTPSTTSVVYDGDANESDCPLGGRFMLYNITRGTSRIVTTHNRSTNTFTTVATTDSWADNDSITTALYNTGDSLSTYMSIDVSDVVPSGATAFLLGIRSTLANADTSSHLYIHPLTTYNEVLRWRDDAVGGTSVNTLSSELTVKNYSRQFALDWKGSASTNNTFYISVKGWWT